MAPPEPSASSARLPRDEIRRISEMYEISEERVAAILDQLASGCGENSISP